MKSFPRFAPAAAAVLLILSLATGCGASGGASTAAPSRTVLTMGVQEEYSAYLFHAGVRQGFFESAGISDIKTTAFTSLPAMLTAVAQNHVDFGMQTIPTLRGYNKDSAGSDLVAFGNFGNLTSWYARSGSNVPTAGNAGWKEVIQSWRGKKIGLPALGGIMDKELRYMLAQAGLDASNDVGLVAVGSQQSAAAAFQQGLVDVVGVTASSAAFIETRNLGYQVLNNQSGPEELKGTITGAFFASKDQIRDRPEYYRGIAEGMEKSRAFVTDPKNREAALEVLTEDIGLPADVAQRVYSLDLPGVTGGTVTREVFDKSIAAMTTTGIISGDKPAYEDVVAGQLIIPKK